jgi:hypothetical protein
VEPLRGCAEAAHASVDQLGLTPPGKLACYANSSEGSSSGGSWRCLLPPIDDNNEEEEEEKEAPRRVFHSGDYVLNDKEDAMSNPAGRSIGAPARGVAEGGSRPPCQAGDPGPRLRVGRVLLRRSPPRHRLPPRPRYVPRVACKLCMYEYEFHRRTCIVMNNTPANFNFKFFSSDLRVLCYATSKFAGN